MITFGFLSTYPPTACGLASFTASLRAALPAGAAGGVVRLLDTPTDTPTDTPVGTPVSAAGTRPAGVVGELAPGSAAGIRDAVALLNRHDVAVVQHDYDVYGGADGEDVLSVLAMLSVPAVVVLHTVLTEPTPHQRAVLNGVVAAAAAVVTMSEAARARLVAGYQVPADRVHVIPHGAADTGGTAVAPHRSQRPQVLTWGLLGPGKGIEWGIDAMALLADLRSAPRYVVAGRTHPKVLAQEGESYRNFLAARAENLAVADRVQFDSRYLDAHSLRRLVNHANVVLLPYDSREQVTSGVLIEAVSSRTPVVATRFPHAVELLSGGAGILVDHQDPVSIAAALRRVLTDGMAAAKMAVAAGVAARPLGWSSVAREYCQLATSLVRPPARALA